MLEISGEIHSLHKLLENMTVNALEGTLWKVSKVGKVRNVTWWMAISWRTSWWMPKLIRRLWWIYPYSSLVDGTVCNPSVRICWKNLLMRMNRGCWSEFQTETILVTLYLERRSASSDQHMKKLMSLREDLHVMMQCFMRQHFADRSWLHEHPGGHASWREPTMRKFTTESTTYFVRWLVCRWNILKMQSLSSDYVRKTTNGWRLKIAWESYFEEHAKEVWKENLMNLEMQTTKLSTYPRCPQNVQEMSFYRPGYYLVWPLSPSRELSRQFDQRTREGRGQVFTGFTNLTFVAVPGIKYWIVLWFLGEKNIRERERRQ